MKRISHENIENELIKLVMDAKKFIKIVSYIELDDRIKDIIMEKEGVDVEIIVKPEHVKSLRNLTVFRNVKIYSNKDIGKIVFINENACIVVKKEELESDGTER